MTHVEKQQMERRAFPPAASGSRGSGRAARGATRPNMGRPKAKEIFSVVRRWLVP